jgi:hypothetical protein
MSFFDFTGRAFGFDLFLSTSFSGFAFPLEGSLFAYAFESCRGFATLPCIFFGI